MPLSTKSARLLMLMGVVGLGLTVSPAPAQHMLLDSRFRAKDVVLPYYVGFESDPLAILRVDSVFGDHQRRGFFRIGALPVLVLEGSQLEIRDPARLAVGLQGIKRNLGLREDSRRAVEVRGFVMTLITAEQPRLSARRLFLTDGGTWELADGSVAWGDGQVVSFQTASLNVAGSKVGVVDCRTGTNVVSVSLLSKPVEVMR